MESESSPTPIGIVEGFCAAWGGLDMDAAAAALHGDIHYHNIPMEELSGKAVVEAYLRNAAARFDTCQWDLLSIAASGQKVLTERVDRFTIGSTSIALPIMGIFEIEDGLIRRWRDYFDLAGYRSQFPPED